MPAVNIILCSPFKCRYDEEKCLLLPAKRLWICCFSSVKHQSHLNKIF